MSTVDPRLALGLDIGGSSVKAGLISFGADDQPVMRATGIRALPPDRELGPTLDGVVSLAGELTAQYGMATSVGVALPGIIDHVAGSATVLPNFPSEWIAVPIRESLQDQLGQRVHLVNDAKAFAFAEARMGAGVGKRTVACVALGTGVGGGIVIDGQLWSGQGTAGEFGHINVELTGPLCGCGNHGCVEAFAGADAIARSGGRSTAEEVFYAAARGSAGDRAVISRAIGALGGALANVFITLAPDLFIIGGGMAASDEHLLDPLTTEIRRRVRVAPAEQIRVVRGALGRHAGAVGAALLGSLAVTTEQLEREGAS